MTHPLVWPRTHGFLWCVCIAMAALADLLFYGYPRGWSTALFAGMMVGVLVARSPGLWRSWSGRMIVGVVGVSLLALVEEPSPLAMLIVIVGTGTLVLVSQRDWGDRVSNWFVRWGRLLVTMWLRVILDNWIVGRWIFRHPRAGGRMLAGVVFVVRWVIPLAAGGVFILLFALANPIVERWLRASLDQLWIVLDWVILVQVDRVFLWIVVGVGAYGLMRYRRMGVRRRAEPLAMPSAVVASKLALSGHAMVIRCLMVFNAVFAVQTMLDGVYLFGGRALPPGMTFAHYAHRGAYPLVFTALIAGVSVLIAFRTGGLAQRSVKARVLVYFWIAQNIFLLFSTIWRLWLYVDAFSLTRLRVAAMVWVMLVACGLLWIIARIVAAKSNGWLWRMNTVTLFAVLYVCAFVNFDGLIADFNVRHCAQVDGGGAAIDIDYLRWLGPEALPALAWLRERNVVDPSAINAATGELQRELAGQLSDWRGWTYRRWREAPAELRQTVAARR